MPLLHILWSIFLIFLLVAWIWVLISVIADVFRSKDLNGFAKALWIIGIIIIPWLGVLVYLMVRGDGMHERSMQIAMDMENMQRDYIRSVAEVSTADELAKLGELKEKGVITDKEFKAQKAKLLV
ncbi:MAG: SHOCT domain-containing protein [Hyphomicrobiales bacterium]